LEDAKKLVSSFQFFKLAESLGGVESLVDHPATMTHGSIPRDLRIANGLEDGLMRFSVGIEDKDDLLQDLEQQLHAFKKV
jgi:cystathionine beta-lyase/cystathionine gamma-synthase